jgi:hypothetical protein
LPELEGLDERALQIHIEELIDRGEDVTVSG